ncbi:hypothetical protein R1sor_025730 [Riccia sorocarpa]|uniref:Endonuclease/exonuclease/phosphatase domain-containing protein n=1 Tax=Riccia sorocarpa TaxID=122646 RepID=A0ABD3G9F1_9MARC
MRSVRLILEGQAGSCRDKVRSGNVSLAQGADYGAEETDDATSNVAAHGAGQMEETLLCVAADVAEPRAWQTVSARERQRTRGVMVGQSTGGGSRWGSDLKKGLDASWVDGIISWTTLAQQLETMQVATSEGEGSMGEIRLIDLNIAKAAARLGRLRRAAVVVQIFEISPSRDRVVAWVQDTMEIWLGVAVSQVTALSRKEFLVVFTTEEDRDEVIAQPPGFLDGKAVRIVKWENRQSTKLTANMKNELKYANVRVCILVDVSLDLPQFVGIKTPWEKTYLQPVVYTRLPDRCLLCQGKAIGQGPVLRKGMEIPGVMMGQMRSREEQGVQGNRFAVLDDNEDADMVIAADDEDQLPKGDLEKGLKLKTIQGTSFKRNLSKTFSPTGTEEDQPPAKKSALSTKAIQEKARVGRAPKKKAVGKTKVTSLAWLDESTNTEDESSSDPSDVDEAPVDRRVFGELTTNVHRPDEGDSSWFSLGESSGHKPQPLADGLAQGGKALLLHESLQVVDHGVGRDGRLAWARVRRGSEVIGLLTIQALNKRRLRLEFWNKIKEIIQEGEWLLIGDFNQVDLPEDSFGKSTLGREERWWRQFLVERGLVDCYISTAVRTGGRFTRMAKKKSRFVGSRLDRGYLTSGAGWIHHVKDVGHHNTSRLSDHVPVSVVLQVEPEESNRHFKSYFKMSFYELADPVVKARAKAAWLNEAELVHDSRRRWARGWQRVKQVLCEVQKEKGRVRREESGLAAEIAWRRDMITEDSSAEEVQALARMEGRLKAQELSDAREWKMGSREKWIGEDAAPARYFFTRLKVKWARKAIVALEDKDGEFLTNREEIFG